jgi:hypothetical protein
MKNINNSQKQTRGATRLTHIFKNINYEHFWIFYHITNLLHGKADGMLELFCKLYSGLRFNDNGSIIFFELR